MDLTTKELGAADMFPTAIKHSPDGHMFSVFNDKEFSVIRTATFKNAKTGPGADVSWSTDKDFAVRDSTLVKIYRNNEVSFEFKPESVPTALFGGPVLCVVSSNGSVFYDWQNVKPVCQVLLSPKKVYWNDAGTLVAFLLP